jgi:hypothetical protein
VATSPRRWRLCGHATSVVRTITAQATLGVPTFCPECESPLTEGPRAGTDEFWQDGGQELAGAGNQKPGKMSIYVRLQGRITGCLVSYGWQLKLPTRQ